MKRILTMTAIVFLLISVSVYAGTGLGTNSIGVNNADNAFNSDTVAANADGSVLERQEFVQDAVAAVATIVGFEERAVSKTISTITNGTHGLFTIAGGPIKILEISSYVATEIGAEGNLVNYNINPTTPASDTVFGTDGTALETNADAVGTLYTWDGVVAADLTATTNGVALGVAVVSGLVAPAGAVELSCANDNAVAGAITVYMRYAPLASGVTVVAQ